MIHLLLFSEKAKMAKEMERKRYKKKIAAAFSKHVSGQRYKFNQYNIIEGIEFSMSAVSKYRKKGVAAQKPSSALWSEGSYSWSTCVRLLPQSTRK